MKNLKLFILGFFLIPLFSIAQEGQNLKISVHNFKYLQNQKDFHGGETGIECEMDLHFSEVITDFFKKSFQITWKLIDQNNQVVYNSELNASSNFNKKEYSSPSVPFDEKNPSTMEDKNVALFIAYKDLNLEEGTHQLTLVLSATNKIKNHPDFWKEKIIIEQKTYQKYTINEQEFDLQNFNMNYKADGFAIKEKCLLFSFDLFLKYYRDNLDTKGYKLYWKILNQHQQVIFNSEIASSVHHRYELIHINNIQEKGFDKIKLYLQYQDIKLNTPEEVTFIILAEDDTKNRREILKEKMYLDIPEKYKYEDQEFTIKNLHIFENKKDGVQGINCVFNISFKYNSTLQNLDKGDNYCFYLNLYHSNKEKVSLYKSYKKRQYTSNNFFRVTPSSEKESHEVNIFIPYRIIQLEQGSYPLNYELKVTDENKRIQFPILQTGNFELDQPQKKSALIRIDKLVVEYDKYDAQVLNFGSTKPDLQWHLLVGKDLIYQTKTMKNSFSAFAGSATINYVEGDEINIVVYDIDKTVFNPNDFIESYTIPYTKQKTSFSKKDISHGSIEKLTYSFK